MMQGRQINNGTFLASWPKFTFSFCRLVHKQMYLHCAIFRRTVESRTLEMLLFRVELAETVHNPLTTCPKRSQCWSVERTPRSRASWRRKTTVSETQLSKNSILYIFALFSKRFQTDRRAILTVYNGACGVGRRVQRPVVAVAFDHSLAASCKLLLNPVAKFENAKFQILQYPKIDNF
jgi:hypothetical protein